MLDAVKSINAQAKIEYADNLLSDCIAAAIFDDNGGPINNTDHDIVGEIYIEVSPRGWREDGRTITDEGREQISAEHAALCRVRDVAERFGQLESAGYVDHDEGSDTTRRITMSFHPETSAPADPKTSPAGQ